MFGEIFQTYLKRESVFKYVSVAKKHLTFFRDSVELKYALTLENPKFFRENVEFSFNLFLFACSNGL